MAKRHQHANATNVNERPARTTASVAASGYGNAAQAEALGLTHTGSDIPGTGPLGVDLHTWMNEGLEPLATTKDGHTTVGPQVYDHPQRDNILAHEAVHRMQFECYTLGHPAASRDALETEAQQGAHALAEGRDFQPRLGAPPGMALHFTPGPGQQSIAQAETTESSFDGPKVADVRSDATALKRFRLAGEGNGEVRAFRFIKQAVEPGVRQHIGRSELGHHGGLYEEPGMLWGYYVRQMIGLHKVEMVLEAEEDRPIRHAAFRETDEDSRRMRSANALYFRESIHTDARYTSSAHPEMNTTYTNKKENYHPEILEGSNKVTLIDAVRMYPDVGDGVHEVEGVWTVVVYISDISGKTIETWTAQFAVFLRVDAVNLESSSKFEILQPPTVDTSP